MSLKRTTAEVAEYFRQQGCELLDEYLGCMTHMNYICSCGEKGRGSWNNFTKGKRCGKCTKWGQAKKRHVDEVRRIFFEAGCEFLDNEFRGVHYKHRYRCRCGREATVSFAAFNKGSFCMECGFEKLRGEKHWAWQKDRQALAGRRLFRKKIYKALSSSLEALNQEKLGHTSDLLGYSPRQLQEYVEQHPNWPHVKDGPWHLDHIFPIQAFLDYGIKDLKLINRLDNLQPLTQKENNRKKDKYDKDAFEDWLTRNVKN